MKNALERALSVPVAAALLAYDALDAIFGPAVRPMLRWAGRLRVFQRIGAWIGGLPPYGALALLAVPFAAIEPFKFVALYWLAQGRVALGVVALVSAHLLSLLVCERIFHAGKARMLEIGWFARGYGFVTALRARAMAWLRSTAAWAAAARVADRIRRAFGGRRLGSR